MAFFQVDAQTSKSMVWRNMERGFPNQTWSFPVDFFPL